MTVTIDDTQARMDRMYRHQRRIYDATRRYYLLGRTHLLENLSPPASGTVLEVGCGTASNLIEAAERYPAARCYGFDISTEMLITARRAAARHRLAPSLTLKCADATNFDTRELFGVPAFDCIFTSYTLSMIADWPVVLERMALQLAPGGAMHVVDFGNCAGLPRIAKALLYGWLDTFGVRPREDLEEKLRGVAQTHNLDLTFGPLFGGYAQYGVLVRR